MSKLFLSERDIQNLLSMAFGSRRDYALFHTAFATGLRAGDLLNLKKSDVSRYGEPVKRLRIKMQKTKEIIERPLPDACQLAIGRYVKSRRDGNPFLFCSESLKDTGTGKPMHRSSFHRLVKHYLNAMYGAEELRGNACHVTRRSVAKLISDKAGRVEPATQFLGHTSIANTIRYLDMDQYGKQADSIVEDFPWNAAP